MWQRHIYQCYQKALRVGHIYKCVIAQRAKMCLHGYVAKTHLPVLPKSAVGWTHLSMCHSPVWRNVSSHLCGKVLRVDWGAERLIAQRMVYHERKGICENNRGVEYGTV